ncbi:Rpn family recombination-promoting nuclease/putative transposase [Argonema galeatum]|uniref:Rpn family recombination-promoting nuclease/putative transposase n=1 Tax=Argonema galeatum TaxID=2942762 RepID=UPI0020124D01|nr:Rpn family recombination-promoting nuclease/putative transposase [Argonema galeatum]MCL1464618.1 Rpn family recombination-promoting nuclease/putative transposase [Argonema galeatum A003/A1]
MQFDNLCKYLAEKYPDRFASWLLGQPTTSVEVLKTELSLEPIRADSVTLLRTQSEILNAEFQVQVPTGKPMPLWMLNYWVRLYWQYNFPVTQVLIWLQPNNNPAVFEHEFRQGLTSHGYQVIRMWEQSPEPLLQYPGLLPMAVLAATCDATGLLNRVASEVAKIESTVQRQEILASTEILAGLRFNRNLIRNLFREGIMRESVIYQDILEEGRIEGKQEEALKMVMRPLTHRFGVLDGELQSRLGGLSVEELEDLNEALFDFSDISDLVNWLEERGGI